MVCAAYTLHKASPSIGSASDRGTTSMVVSGLADSSGQTDSSGQADSSGQTDSSR